DDLRAGTDVAQRHRERDQSRTPARGYLLEPARLHSTGAGRDLRAMDRYLPGRHTLSSADFLRIDLRARRGALVLYSAHSARRGAGELATPRLSVTGASRHPSGKQHIEMSSAFGYGAPMHFCSPACRAT